MARPESTRGLRRRISTPPTPGGEQPSTCPPFGSGYEKRKGARLGRRETRPHSRCLLRTRLPPRYPQAPPLHSAGITTRFTLWGHSHATPCSTNRIQFVLHPVAWACSTLEHVPRFFQANAIPPFLLWSWFHVTDDWETPPGLRPKPDNDGRL